MKKAAIVGINDEIINTLLNELDSDKLEIVAFFDNSEDKQSLEYIGLKVFDPESYITSKFNADYFIITALSAYQTIKSQLERLGIRAERIQPFIPEMFCKYVVGPVQFNEDLISEIYLDPVKTLEIAHRYQEQFLKYTAYEPYSYERDAWYNKTSLIAHALGGRIGKEKLEYTNSLEAFQTSISNEFTLMECDVCTLRDRGVVLAHENCMLWECKVRSYTTLNLEQLFRKLQENSFLTVLIDVKWKDHDDYTFIVSEIEKNLRKVSMDEESRLSLKKQIVMQVYDEETIICAKASGFQMFFTQYRNQRRYEFMNTIDLCYRYGIKVVGMGLWPEEPVQKKYMKAFVDKNIKLFGYSTDLFDDYRRLIDMGFTGVITNFLRPKDITCKGYLYEES
jgi:glycerophosphoryl diester phosphodiesterase